MQVKSWIIGVLLLATIGLASGYITAYASRARCASLVRAELQAKPKIGYAMGAEAIRVGPADVEGWVAGPFRVDASYMVPRGLHGTIYTSHFLALPWAWVSQGTQVVDLL